MNKTLTTILTTLAIIILAGVIFFAGSVYARSHMMLGWSNSTFGPNVMFQMMKRSGMMNGQNGMMSRSAFNNSIVAPLTIDEAKAAAEKYLANLNGSDLEIAEVMVFENNAYVVVKETATGNGAFELLLDPASQTAIPEYGPNMMWNLKYSGLNHQNMISGNRTMMGGYSNMMSRWDSTTPLDVPVEMTITPAQAIEYAQKYLDANIAGATAATDPIQFYGYYTMDFEKDGKVAGMLSVNGYSGQVFLHTWHGTFITEAQSE